MILLINPKFSFVQFTNEVADVLPVALPSDLMFQFNIEGTKAEIDNLMLSDPALSVIKPTGNIVSDVSLDALTIISYQALGLTFLKLRLTANRILFYWPHGLLNIEPIKPGVCFRLGLKVGSSNFYTSNKFQKVALDQYTSTIWYECNENAYNFFYCADDTPNKARLPFFLSKPQYIDDESIYVKSTGEITIQKSITKKEFEGITDYITDDLHEKFKIALSNDNVIVESYKYNGPIRKNGNYEITWLDFEEETGRGNFKVYTTPYKVRNSNCETCEPLYVEPEPECTPFTYTATDNSITVNWPNVPGETSVVNVYLDAERSQLFASHPVTNSGSDTITDLEAGGTYYISLQPAGRTVLCDLVSVKTTGGVVCDPVVIPQVQLPDGRVNIPYPTTTINLSGTPPFSYNNLVIPYGLFLTRDGAAFTISGTPAAAADNIPVSFDVVNPCGGATFSDSVNITSAPALTQVSNVEIGQTRQQTFLVGPAVFAGDKFMLMVYSHDVTITAVQGDTSATIAQKLAAAVNNTTAVQWDDHDAAPNAGTPGFKPTATVNGSQIILTLNLVNQFAGNATAG